MATWLQKAVQGAGKVMALSPNPIIRGASAMITGTNKSSTSSKVETKALNTQVRAAGASGQSAAEASEQQTSIITKVKNFVVKNWMYLAGGFVVIAGVWYFFIHKKKATARRRTSKARAARAVNRKK